MRLRIAARAAQLLLGIAFPASAWAAQDSTKVVQLEGVTVEAPRAAATTGGSSAVTVSLDSIAGLAAPSMEEFLRRSPLIQIRSNSRGEAQPSLRGAEDRQVAILLDGIPITLGWDHRTDLSIIPLTAVRRMTLSRGLASLLHGPNVLAGALEFDVVRKVRTEPGDDRPLGAAEVSMDHLGALRVSATAEAGGETRSGTTWRIRSGAGYRSRSGIAVPAKARTSLGLELDLLEGPDQLRLNSDLNQADAFVAGRVEGLGGTWLSALASGFRLDRGVPPEAHTFNARYWRHPSQGRIFATASAGTGARRAGFGEHAYELSLGVDHFDNEIEQYGGRHYEWLIANETGVTTTFTGRARADLSLDGFGQLRAAATVADVRHRERQGPDLDDYEQVLWSLAGEAELGGGALGGGARGRSMIWTVGFSADGAATPKSGDKEPLGMLLGHGFRGGFSKTALDGNGLIHAGLGRRVRFPSLRELYSGALGRFQPNPFLVPETAHTAEAGFSYARGSLNGQVVGFLQRLDDGIARRRAAVFTGSTSEGQAVFSRVNQGVMRSMGIEVLGSHAIGPVSFGGDVTLQRVIVKERPKIIYSDEELVDGLLAEYQPTLLGSVHAGVRIGGGVSTETFVRFKSSQHCIAVDGPGYDKLGASAAVDLEASRVFQIGGGRSMRGVRRLLGTVGVGNALDALVFDQCGLPQPGRTLRFQIKIQ